MNNTTFISRTNSIIELEVAATGDAIIELEVAATADGIIELEVVRISSSVEKVDPKIQVPAPQRDLLPNMINR
jgi:hypothetical protein